MDVYVRAKFEISSIILTGFSQGVILPPPPIPQNEPLKSPPRLGLRQFQGFPIIAGICPSLTKCYISQVIRLILWLQYIYQINICRKRSFPIKLSLIFTLVVRETLTLTQQIFIDSVNFIVHTCDIKYEQIYHYLPMKVKLHQLSTSFQANFKVCLKEFQKQFWWIHDGLPNFIIPTLLNMSPRVSQSGDRVREIRPSLTK